VLVGISGTAWFSLAYLGELNLSNLKDFAGFVKWGWKIKIFRGWLVPFPNLNGSWVGYIHSEWKNPETGKKPDPIPVMLTVSQSFFHISCLMRTGEMESYSYSEGFLIDTERQIKKVAYSYTSNPRLSLNERSISHDGTVVFNIIEKPKRKLVGRYWTERLTKGEIIIEYYSRELLEEIPENLGDHPVTEIKNRR
jgi:hypothetical protein